jgi:hypothetical protein
VEIIRRNVNDTKFTFDTDRFSFSKLTSLNMNSYYQTRQEKADERQTILAGGAAFAQKIGEYVNSTFNYENVRTIGLYPFQSNQIQTQNRLQSRLAYTGKSHKIGTTITSNLWSAYYDLEKEEAQKSALNGAQSDVTLTFKQNKENEYRLYLRANYDYDDTNLSHIWPASMRTPKLYYKLDIKLSDVFNWQTSTSYDRITNKADSLNSTLRFTVDPFWAFDVQAIYDYDTHEMRTMSYVLQRDLHCAYATLRANPKLREFFLELGLKAFSDDKRGFQWDKLAKRVRMQKNSGGGII